ncbi:MAG: acyl carrier protein [Oligoflexus sp.]
MELEQLQQSVMNAMTKVAPDLQVETLKKDRDWRDQIDFDSVDYLNFVIALNQSLGIEIPEKDYPKLDSFDHAVQYLNEKLKL